MVSLKNKTGLVEIDVFVFVVKHLRKVNKSPPFWWEILIFWEKIVRKKELSYSGGLRTP